MGTVRSSGTLNVEGALVIGGDYRALGIVRSLGRQGIPVWVLTNEHRVATASRYVKKKLNWPTDEREQIHYLNHLCDRHKLEGWAIFPSDDEATAFLARHYSSLATRFRITTPPWDILRLAYDKRLTYRLAEQAGVAQPHTFVPENREALAAVDCTFPVILKPAFKQDANRFTHDKAWRADDRQALIALYDEACQLVDPRIILIQEFIPGGGEEQVSYAALCKDGVPLASITARRTRQYPMDFGRASSFVESIDAPELEQPARRLLKAMGITGLVEIEFKRHPVTGAYELLDINARVWGWHSLGAGAGVDFPYLLWQMIHDETPAEVHGRSGVRWVRMLTDAPAATGEILTGGLTVRNYLRSLRTPIEFAIFAADDPLPALMDGPVLAGLAWKRNRAARMCATISEFQYRDIIIRLIYAAAIFCYLIDPDSVGTLMGSWLSREVGGFSETVWKRGVLSLGVALVLVAASIRTWATAYLRYDVMRNPKIHTDRLISEGPFGYVRNPLYVGNLFMVAGVSPMLSPTGVFVLVVGSIVFIYRLVRREEAELSRTHGEAFREYCRKVPRFIPSLRPRAEGVACTPSLKNGLVGELLLWIIAIALGAYAATFDIRIFVMIFACAFIPGATRRMRRMLQREDA